MKIKIENSCGLKLLEKIRIMVTLPYIEGKLLDIGCGYNNLVKNYKGKGVGVDVYNWPGVDILVKNTSQMDFFKKQSFDTVTFIACLNHIPYRKQVLEEANRLLIPGGRLIITMISSLVGNFWHKIAEPLWGEKKHGRKAKSGERGGLDEKELIQLIERAGFTLEKKEKFLLGLNNLYLARKW